MIIASCVATVGAEVTFVMAPLEGHAEVITLGVHREPQVFDLLLFASGEVKQVKSSHTRMPVGGEIEVAVGTERGEHLVTRCVDRCAQVLYASCFVVTIESAAPDVIAA